MCSTANQAQEVVADTIKKKRVSNEYIEMYDDYIKLRLGFSNSFNSFHIKDNEDNLDFTLFKGPDKVNKFLDNPTKPKKKTSKKK